MMPLLAWSAWLLFSIACGALLVRWVRQTGELIAPFPLVLATLGFYFVPRAFYLLWFHQAPLSSAGLPYQDQLQLMTTAMVVGLLSLIAFAYGHGRQSAVNAAARIRFALPESDPARGFWIAGAAAIVGVLCVAYLVHEAGGLGYALRHQYELSDLLQGKKVFFEVSRLLIVPTALLLIDPVKRRSRWWVWVLAIGSGVILYALGRRSLVAMAIGYPIALYHLTIKRIPKRFLITCGIIGGVALFSLSYIRLIPSDRLAHALGVFVERPVAMIHFANSTGELKVFDATTIIIRDVPRDMGYTFGASFARVPWMVVPRAIWPSKPNTLGNVLLANNLPNLHTGYPPTAIGEFFVAGGWLGVMIGFLAFGWLARTMWEWRNRNSGIGNASIYLACCFFAFDFTRVGDPSRTVWFFLIGVSFFTIAFSLAAGFRPREGSMPYDKPLIRLT